MTRGGTTQGALLVLEDGTHFEGRAFGASARAMAEVVFNTSMSGYQEILTDPSYRGQIVTMTAPHIGNCGVNPLDVESSGVQVAGLVVRAASRISSNYRATATLQEYLEEHGTPAITEVDTRALTRHLRDEGAMMGALVHGATAADAPDILRELKAAPRYDEQDWIAAASVRVPSRVHVHPTGDIYRPTRVEIVPESEAWLPDQDGLPDVLVLDFGVKYSILRQLAATGCRLTLMPHDTPAEVLIARRPAGILLSNGPGDPARLDAAVATIRALLGQQPMFGICLGHQLLARAVGAETFKLKFGHRGPNQPVLERDSGRVQITAQNHGYAVRLGEGLAHEVELTYVNLNDETVEGMRLPSLQAFSVQHHPEAGPGPNDAMGCFADFHRTLRVAP